jgi:hypothetical protein
MRTRRWRARDAEIEDLFALAVGEVPSTRRLAVSETRFRGLTEGILSILLQRWRVSVYK